MVDLFVVRKGGIQASVDAAIAAQKGAASGIAPLDAASKVPAANSRVESVAGRQGAITLGVADVSGAVASSTKGQANGVAPLDASNLVPEIHIPAVAITDTFLAASEAEMLALTAQRGDVAIRSDINKSFVLRLTPASTLANWAELRTPTDAVLSVNGRTGAVNLSDLFAAVGDARLRTIRDEGVALADRAILDFLGTGVIVEDDSVTGRTKVTISGAAAGAASETAAGITEQATQAEVEAGTAGNLFATVARLKAELDRRQTPEAWITPTLVNGWANSGGALQVAQYRKEPGGMVRLRGSVVGSTSGTIFTLPTGYIPPAQLPFAVDTTGGTTAVNVNPSGTVTVAVSSNVRVSFNGIAFAL